ncbi:MAG: riboflavin synthase [Actinomycetota bacterium]|jgi:riboflavin synthase|nr:riboflavin synthase [Actinomycetota bacterium]
MFTGIVEELGRLRSRDRGRFVFEATTVLDDVKIGDSVAHNGCCLTVVERGDDWYAVDVIAESLARTNLGDVQVGDVVNLERPVRASDRLDGHIVQGHVDCTGEVVSPAPDLEVKMPPELLRYVVEKGSITVDGCSLTVVKVLDDGFSVAIIPHTAEVTTLGLRQPGDRVNLEVDLVAKYVERLLEHRTQGAE